MMPGFNCVLEPEESIIGIYTGKCGDPEISTINIYTGKYHIQLVLVEIGKKITMGI